MLSQRAEKWISEPYGLMEGLFLALENPFHPDQKPDGCINLGSAENDLMFAETAEKVKQSSCLTLAPQDVRYGDMQGLLRFRTTMASFLNQRLRVCDELTLKWQDISLHNGCGTAVEALFHVIADVGDGVLLPSPYYGGFEMDLERRARVKILPVPLTGEDHYELTADKLDTVYQAAIKSGCRVSALLLVNPDNPLGRVLSPTSLLMLVDFAATRGLHLVMDEIYAMSVFDANTKFQSIFSLNHLSVLNYSDSIHVIWGFSKDFCVNGFRAGIVASKNLRVIKALSELAYFSCVPSITQNLLCDMMEDSVWVDKFVATNADRMRQCYALITGRISEFNASLNDGKSIRYLPATAGFFLWCDFRDFLPPAQTCEEQKHQERRLFLKFITDGPVYIAPGAIAFNSMQPGHFRIIFAAQPRVLLIALDRVFKVLVNFN